MSKSNVEKVQRGNVESKVLYSIYEVTDENQNGIMQSGKQSSWLIKMQRALCLEVRQQNSAETNGDVGLSMILILYLLGPLGVDNN